MNPPYDNAKDAVEFWQKVAARFGMRLIQHLNLPHVIYDEQNGWIWDTTDQDEFDAFTRDMLARCVLWLYAKRYTVVRCTDSPFWLIAGHPPIREGEDGSNLIRANDCIFTAHRDAVLAVSGEGDKQ